MEDVQSYHTDGKKELNLPIIAFPPFKLRSSLIDKDPVIWVHVLEYYIDLFRKLMILTDRKQNSEYKLNTKSTQQLTTFMRGYLYEVSEESTRIFSLGAINPDIVTNQKLLKIVVFQFIKGYNLANLRLTGESVWNFAKIYVRLAHENQSVNQSLINLSIVRNLIKGTIKSKLSSKSDDVSLIKMVHDHLNTLISSAKFTKVDLDILSILLGQKMKNNINSNNRSGDKAKKNFINNKKNGNNNNNASSQGSDFAEDFVNTYWIGLLEKLYNDGQSIHAKQCFEIMVISLVSLPTIKISKLLSTSGLAINNKITLIKLHPLLAKILLSKKFSDINPDLHDKLQFLNNANKKITKPQEESSSPRFDQGKIDMIGDLFPQLTQGQIKQLLHQHNNDANTITNMLLESPDIMNTLKEYEPEQPSRKITSTTGKVKVGSKSKKTTERSFYKGGELDLSKLTLGKTERPQQLTLDDLDDGNDLKKWNLTRALQILNPEDDEPDDTYVDQERTTGTATEPALSRKQRRQQQKAEIKKTNNKQGRGGDEKEEDNDEYDEDDGVDDLGEGRDDIDLAEEEAENIKKEMSNELIENLLFQIYIKSPQELQRDSRNSKSRKELREKTKWSDEQIEGWAKMVQRNPRILQALEENAISSFDGPLNDSNYQAPSRKNKKPSGSGSGGPLTAEQQKRQQARKNKNKAKSGNHNRKSAHDRKVAQ